MRAATILYLLWRLIFAVITTIPITAHSVTVTRNPRNANNHATRVNKINKRQHNQAGIDRTLGGARQALRKNAGNREKVQPRVSKNSTLGSNSTMIDSIELDDDSGAPPEAIQPMACACSEGKAILVVVDSNSGSTWLGQMLQHHKCSSEFIPPGQI